MSDTAEDSADLPDAATTADVSADAALPVDATQAAPGCPGGAGCPCSGDDDCDDQNPCTYGAACVDGACDGGLAETCDDGNECTQDTCDLSTGCSNTAADSWCSDGDPCTFGDACSGGACKSGKALPCDDGNLCTTDSCVPGQGCQYAHNKVECAPSNDCVETSYCAYGGCVQGKAKPCDDGQACTYDNCDPKTGCTYLNVPAAAACADGTLKDGKCWKAFKKDGKWADARATCQAWGGELASIANISENKQARAVADAACGQAAAWIGLTDYAQEGQFVWVNGEKRKYGLWHGGEPNNAGDEDVVEITADGGWNDLPGGADRSCLVCVRQLAYACDDGNACTDPTTCSGGTCLPATATTSCDDNNPCTLDGCATDQGCSHTAVDDGAACGSGVCSQGACAIDNKASLLSSCAELSASAPSGLYWLHPSGTGAPFQAWCDNGGDGGGWTLVHKSDGASPDAAYAGTLWTDKQATVNASPLPDNKQAILSGYATVPLVKHQVRVVLRVGQTLRSLVLDAPAEAQTLHALLNGKYAPTQVNLQAWESLLPKGSLQGNCLLQGFAVGSPNGVQARIGILGNNENDCSSVDSWLGVGATTNICGGQGLPTVGNVACWYPDAGDAKTAAFALLYVR